MAGYGAGLQSLSQSLSTPNQIGVVVAPAINPNEKTGANPRQVEYFAPMKTSSADMIYFIGQPKEKF